MTTESNFHSCVLALKDVVAASRSARGELEIPTNYHSNRAAFLLLEPTIRHVHILTNIALMNPVGLHVISALPILRSAFEISLTACWLAKEDNPQEREYRWQGWMDRQTKYFGQIADDIRDGSPEYAEKYDVLAERWRNDSKEFNPSLPASYRLSEKKVKTMLTDCNFFDETYIPYRIGSMLLHGEPAVINHVWEDSTGEWQLRGIEYDAWGGVFKLASWCLAEAGIPVLERAGAMDSQVDRVSKSHLRLMQLAQMLDP